MVMDVIESIWGPCDDSFNELSTSAMGRAMPISGKRHVAMSYYFADDCCLEIMAVLMTSLSNLAV